MKTLRTLLLALLPAMAFAQETPAPAHIKLGINAGATRATIRGNDTAESNDGGFDFLIGASLEVPFSERFSFLTNINYERKSVTNTVEDGFNPDFDPIVETMVDTRLTLSYLSIPLNFKYYFDAKKNFYINGGPFAGIFLGQTLKADGDKVNTDDEDIFKTLDFGVNMGLGTRIGLNDKSSLNVELRDNLGLTNISKVPIIGNGTVKTNSVNLIVCWEFQL